MRNDILKTGGELIMEERERQVLEHSHFIASDAIKYRSGELVQLALALIHNNIEFAPADFDRDQVKRWLDLEATERLILAGAFIAAQIDVFNFYLNIVELNKKYPDVPENKIYIPDSEN